MEQNIVYCTYYKEFTMRFTKAIFKVVTFQWKRSVALALRLID